MTMNTRRSILSMALTTLAPPIALSAAQGASPWPNRQIRIVHGFAPAAATDSYARGVGELITAQTGTSCYVESKAGASGVIGTDFVAKASPDGYTLLVGTAGTHAINVSLYQQLPYDSEKDFEPITLLGDIPNILCVNRDLPVSDVQSFISYVRSKPGQLNFGTSGNGTSMHLAAEQFMAATGTKMTHVPYRQSSGGVTDLISGQIQLMFHHVPVMLPLIKAGTVKALGVTSSSRVSVVPDIPTIAERGLPGFESITWYALFAPRGTPSPIVDRLNGIVTSGLTGLFGKRLRELGSIPRPSTPQELRDTVARDTEYWRAIIKRLNLTPL